MATRRSSQRSNMATHVESISGEKEEKLERSNKQRLSFVFSFLGTLAFLFLVSFVKMKHSPYGPNAVRSRREQKGLSQNSNMVLPPNSIYRLTVQDSRGSPLSLERFAGMVSLVVNVACKWGKTDVSYRQLAQLQEKFGRQGFQVLAFPTNDWNQEFQNNDEIQDFVSSNFPDVSFLVLGLTHLPENSVYQELQRQRPNDHVRHNFFKYLIDRQGHAVSFYDKKTNPLDISDDIEELLLIDSDEKKLHRFVTK